MVKKGEPNKQKRSRRAGAGNGAATAFGTIRLSRGNLVFGLAAIAAVAVGYVLLARGSTVAAPLLLVLGYVVLTPLAIMR
ncbi:MAG: hypothetical protein ACODAE_05840 [Gemmatimonadota bacterium]